MSFELMLGRPREPSLMESLRDEDELIEARERQLGELRREVAWCEAQVEDLQMANDNLRQDQENTAEEIRQLQCALSSATRHAAQNENRMLAQESHNEALYGQNQEQTKAMGRLTQEIRQLRSKYQKCKRDLRSWEDRHYESRARADQREETIKRMGGDLRNQTDLLRAILRARGDERDALERQMDVLVAMEDTLWKTYDTFHELGRHRLASLGIQWDQDLFMSGCEDLYFDQGRGPVFPGPARTNWGSDAYEQVTLAWIDHGQAAIDPADEMATDFEMTDVDANCGLNSTNSSALPWLSFRESREMDADLDEDEDDEDDDLPLPKRGRSSNRSDETVSEMDEAILHGMASLTLEDFARTCLWVYGKGSGNPLDRPLSGWPEESPGGPPSWRGSDSDPEDPHSPSIETGSDELQGLSTDFKGIHQDPAYLKRPGWKSKEYKHESPQPGQKKKNLVLSPYPSDIPKKPKRTKGQVEIPDMPLSPVRQALSQDGMPPVAPPGHFCRTIAQYIVEIIDQLQNEADQGSTLSDWLLVLFGVATCFCVWYFGSDEGILRRIFDANELPQHVVKQMYENRVTNHKLMKMAVFKASKWSDLNHTTAG